MEKEYKTSSILYLTKQTSLSFTAFAAPAPKPKVPAFTRTYPAPVNKIQKRARFDDSLPEYTLGQYFKEDAEIDKAEAENDTEEI